MIAGLYDVSAFLTAMATEPLWWVAGAGMGLLAAGRMIGRRVEAAERDGRVAR